jgi:hypothetical protein
LCGFEKIDPPHNSASIDRLFEAQRRDRAKESTPAASKAASNLSGSLAEQLQRKTNQSQFSPIGSRGSYIQPFSNMLLRSAAAFVEAVYNDMGANSAGHFNKTHSERKGLLLHKVVTLLEEGKVDEAGKAYAAAETELLSTKERMPAWRHLMENKPFSSEESLIGYQRVDFTGRRVKLGVKTRVKNGNHEVEIYKPLLVIEEYYDAYKERNIKRSTEQHMSDSQLHSKIHRFLLWVQEERPVISVSPFPQNVGSEKCIDIASVTLLDTLGHPSNPIGKALARINEFFPAFTCSLTSTMASMQTWTLAFGTFAAFNSAG